MKINLFTLLVQLREFLENDPNIHAVSMKDYSSVTINSSYAFLADLWPPKKADALNFLDNNGPLAWFAQAEAQFALRNIIQDETKYYHVVAALDTTTANRALSVLTSHSSTDKYNAIKSFLTSA
ncbi:Gag pol protein [Elysia marginata]|uniref:Gag pol protein n=1 Tax=Elysia marginata TaxID=1093978 RepID=A0AAV4HP37_9GAST|nr:Gag pol protein [Elysia marginata]